MKIALVHDYLKEYGGAESVLETLSDLYPDAPIYTSLYRPQFFGPHRDRLEKKWHGRIHQSFFGFIPFAHKLLSPFRFLSPLAFRSFDFSGYDIIISSATGAFFPNALDKKTARLICYCHTPPRYLYGLVTARSLDSWFYRLVNIPLQLTLHFYRLFDFKFAQNVDQYIANSRTTAARIQKFYRKDSIVINPPVEINIRSKFNVLSAQHANEVPAREHCKTLNETFYLAGGRLARAKRFDIAIMACNKLKLPLKIFGRSFAGYIDELKCISGPTIEFLGEVTEDQKNMLFSQASAFIFPSDNEDFGIVAVESQACGCPVIGYNSGGIRETVIDDKTGILFNNLTVDSCSAAIQKFQKSKIKPVDCVANAQQFSQSVFINKIDALINESNQ